MNINPKTNPQRDAVLLAQQTRVVGPNSALMRNYKDSLPNLDLFQLGLCVGVLLGDAAIAPNQAVTQLTHRLKFEWGGKNQEYAQHVYDMLSLYCLTGLRTQVRVNAKNNEVTTWCFQTVSVPAFNILAIAFLSGGKKVLDIHALADMITPVSLAYWFMDDGGSVMNNRYTLHLHTQGFTHEEVLALCGILKNKFDLDCWVGSKASKKHKPFIVISGHSYTKFFQLVAPHIIPSMRYKFPTGSRTQWQD
uniref:LAGLIDADG endonuclease n=1 Tax=Sterigmatomyces sp. TaxID=1972484 RepID=A0A7G7XQC3_9BASI|nr:LAGLIDADG endonuclease [Sterigmatomyces sp.]